MNDLQQQARKLLIWKYSWTIAAGSPDLITCWWRNHIICLLYQTISAADQQQCEGSDRKIIIDCWLVRLVRLRVNEFRLTALLSYMCVVVSQQNCHVFSCYNNWHWGNVQITRWVEDFGPVLLTKLHLSDIWTWKSVCHVHVKWWEDNTAKTSVMGYTLTVLSKFTFPKKNTEVAPWTPWEWAYHPKARSIQWNCSEGVYIITMYVSCGYTAVVPYLPSVHVHMFEGEVVCSFW